MNSNGIIRGVKRGIVPGIAAFLYLFDQIYWIPYPGENNVFFLLGLLGWSSLIFVVPLIFTERIELICFGAFLAILGCAAGRSIFGSVDWFRLYQLLYASGGFFLLFTPTFLLTARGEDS